MILCFFKFQPFLCRIKIYATIGLVHSFSPRILFVYIQGCNFYSTSTKFLAFFLLQLTVLLIHFLEQSCVVKYLIQLLFMSVSSLTTCVENILENVYTKTKLIFTSKQPAISSSSLACQKLRFELK